MRFRIDTDNLNRIYSNIIDIFFTFLACKNALAVVFCGHQPSNKSLINLRLVILVTDFSSKFLDNKPTKVLLVYKLS